MIINYNNYTDYDKRIEDNSNKFMSLANNNVQGSHIKQDITIGPYNRLNIYMIYNHTSLVSIHLNYI